MTTHEVAHRLVELCSIGENRKAIEELYAYDVSSHEPDGVPNSEIFGKENLLQKDADFFAQIEQVFHSEISDPVVADNYFAVSMKMEFQFKGLSTRTSMEEICVYHVENGQITREEFFFTPVAEPAM